MDIQTSLFIENLLFVGELLDEVELTTDELDELGAEDSVNKPDSLQTRTHGCNEKMQRIFLPPNKQVFNKGSILPC